MKSFYVLLAAIGMTLATAPAIAQTMAPREMPARMIPVPDTASPQIQTLIEIVGIHTLPGVELDSQRPLGAWPARRAAV